MKCRALKVNGSIEWKRWFGIAANIMFCSLILFIETQPVCLIKILNNRKWDIEGESNKKGDFIINLKLKV